MNKEPPRNLSEKARNHLLASLNALASDDCAQCSQYLWPAARQAAAVVAQRRGWPAGADAPRHSVL